jgi:hypothetical protein
MPWYPRIHAAINRALPMLAPTQATNRALVVSALLVRRFALESELPLPDECPAFLAQRFPIHAARDFRHGSLTIPECSVEESVIGFSRVKPLQLAEAADFIPVRAATVHFFCLRRLLETAEEERAKLLA